MLCRALIRFGVRPIVVHHSPWRSLQGYIIELFTEMNAPHVLVIDGMNFLHRARSGFTGGDHFVVFNAVRNLRAIVGQMQPTRVYMVMEGVPEKRRTLFPQYKANRKVEPGTKKEDELLKFLRQVNEFTDLMENVPVSIVRHPSFEADDTVYNLIRRATTAVPWTVASNDSDFTQLLNEFKHVKLYNPMKKTYVEEPPYDYVLWKALRGDPSDNIPKVPGYSDGKAMLFVEQHKAADAIVKAMVCQPEIPERMKMLQPQVAEATHAFVRNLDLVRFHTWTDEEAMHMLSSAPTRDWERVRARFEGYGFSSLLKEGTWDKFTATFEPLWG